MQRVPLAPIAGGLSEGTVPGEQPRGTYLDGRNVRGIDPRTGQVCWGAQRAGLVASGDATGEAPTHLFQAERPVLRERWVDLTTTVAASTTPSSVAYAWLDSLGIAGTDLDAGQVLDVVASLEGIGYFLLDTGEVALVNDAGKVTERIPAQVPHGFQAVPRLGVDATGGVFVAASRDEPLDQDGALLDGVASLMVRLTKSDLDIWEVVWAETFEHRMTMFAYADGHLYAVLDPPEPLSGDRPEAELVRFAAPLSVSAVAWRVAPLPRPVFDVTIGRGGSCLISCPASPVRFGTDGTAFTERSVTWTPHNLVAADAKLHAWVSGDFVNDREVEPEPGAVVRVMNDRRKKPNPFVEVGGPERDLRPPPGLMFSRPVWDDEAFGGLGGVRFTAQSSLRSGRNTADSDEHELAFLPRAAGYALVMAVQLDEAAITAAAARSIWGQRSFRAANVDLLGLATGGDLQVADEATPVLTGVANVPAASPGGSRAAIVTFMPSTAGAPPVWRINGTAIAAGAAFPSLTSWGPYQVATAGGAIGPFVAGPCFALGEGNPNEANLLADPTCLLTQTGGHPFESLDRIRDESFETRIDLRDDGVTPATIVAAFPAVWTGMDSLRVATNAETLTVEFDSTSIAFGAVTDTFVFDLLQYDSTDLGNGLHVYDLRLGAATPRAARWIRFTFTPRSGTETIRIAEVSLRAQDLNRSLQADTWTFYEAVALNTTQILDVQVVEGYLARKVGLAHELPTVGAGHPYGSDGTMPAVSGDIVDPGGVQGVLRSRYPLLVKYGADGSALAAIASAGVGLGAVLAGDHVLTWGEPNPYGGGAPNAGTLARKLRDNGRAFESVWLLAAGTEVPLVVPTRLATGPCGSLFVPFNPAVGSTGSAAVRRYSSAAGALRWSLVSPLGPVAVAAAGLQIDESLTGGANGPEFLFLGTRGGPRAHRIEVTGRFDSGEPDRVDVSRFRVDTSGAVRRLVDDEWATVEAGALPGARPWSATLYGYVVLGDGRGYRVWDSQNQTLRNFAASVKGYLPPRAKLGLAHTGRLYLAAADNPYALYGCRYGKIFDWDLGPIFEDVNQALAGTTSTQGSIPERITALMPLRDDVLLLGTARKQFAITGDLGRGGRLDEVDPSNGVAFGYAWCVGAAGLYYFSANGGLWLRNQQGAKLISSGRIQRRLEDFDQTLYRLELGYRWQDRTVHIFVIPLSGLEQGLVHAVFDEQLGAWHLDEFAGGFGRQITAVSTLNGGTAAERSLMLGFADSVVREFASHAEDDDGIPIASRATVGPLLGSSDQREACVRGVHGQLASDQGAIEVAVRASESADTPGPIGERGLLEPGRGWGASVQGAGAAVYIEVMGTGRAWCAHQIEVEAEASGEKGNKR